MCEGRLKHLGEGLKWGGLNVNPPSGIRQRRSNGAGRLFPTNVAMTLTAATLSFLFFIFLESGDETYSAVAAFG